MASVMTVSSVYVESFVYNLKSLLMAVLLNSKRLPIISPQLLHLTCILPPVRYLFYIMISLFMSINKRQIIYNINMKIKFIRNNITKIKADVTVNSANPYPVVGSGVDFEIYEAAGKDKLLKERLKVGNIQRGDAIITPGFNLSNYIIHTVGPVYIDGHHDEEKTLRQCYRRCMELVKRYQCHSVVFPLISTGVYGFPKEEAIIISISEINSFLINENTDIEVYISVFDDESYALCLKIADKIETYISSNEANNKLNEEYPGFYDEIKELHKRRRIEKLEKRDSHQEHSDMKTFSEMILYYLNKRNEKSSDLYKRVNIDRRLFSKILNNAYHPSKDTVIRLAIGLGLTIDESIDLLSRADYAFNPSKIEDIIIMQGIKENKKYQMICNDIENIRKG